MDLTQFNRRPLIVAIAGPNGAGKSTFFEAFLSPSGLPFVNADRLSAETGLDAYHAAALADRWRRALVAAKESFIFETVFSDPVGDKVAFLAESARQGYQVLLCFIHLESAEQSQQRVGIRVSQGGHDVPPEKIAARYGRSLANLKLAIQTLPHVLVYDNHDLSHPFDLVAAFTNAHAENEITLPEWLRQLLRDS